MQWVLSIFEGLSASSLCKFCAILCTLLAVSGEVCTVKKSRTNTTNAYLSTLTTHFKSTEGKSETIFVIMHSLGQAILGHILKYTVHVEKSRKIATNVNFESSHANNLKTHLKMHIGNSQTNATNVTIPPLTEAI